MQLVAVGDVGGRDPFTFRLFVWSGAVYRIILIVIVYGIGIARL